MTTARVGMHIFELHEYILYSYSEVTLISQHIFSYVYIHDGVAIYQNHMYPHPY